MPHASVSMCVSGSILMYIGKVIPSLSRPCK
jgi:hypothetical protein